MKEETKEALPHQQTLVGLKERSDTELKTATKRVSIAEIMAQYKSKATNANYKSKRGSDHSASIPDLPHSGSSGSSSRYGSQDEEEAIMNTIERVALVNGKRRNSMFGAAGKSASRLLKGARRASQPEVSTNLEEFLSQQAKEYEEKYQARINALEQANEEMMAKLNESESKLNQSGGISSELSGLVNDQAVEMQKLIAVCEQQKEHIAVLEKKKLEIEVVAQKRRVSLQEQKTKLESTTNEVTQLKRDRKSLRKQLKEQKATPGNSLDKKQQKKKEDGPPPLLTNESTELLEQFQDTSSKRGEESLKEICQRQKDQLDLLRLDKEMMEEALENAEREKQELEIKIKSLQNTNDSLADTMKLKDTELERMDGLHSNQVDTIASLKDAIEDQSTDIENLEHDNDTLEIELEAAQTKIELQETEIHSLEADKALFVKKLTALDTIQDTAEAQLEEIIALQEENQSLTKKLQVVTKSTAEEKKLKIELEQQAAELQRMKEKNAELEEATAELQCFKSQAKAQETQLRELAEEKKQMLKARAELELKIEELQTYKTQFDSQRDALEWLKDEKEDCQRRILELEATTTELQAILDNKTMQIERDEDALKQKEENIESLRRLKDEANLVRKMQSDEISKLKLEIIAIRKLEKQECAEKSPISALVESEFNVEQHITQLATLTEAKSQAVSELTQLRETVKKQASAIEEYEKKFNSLTSLVLQKQSARNEASSEPLTFDTGRASGVGPIDEIMSCQSYDYDESTLGDDTATWDGEIGTKSHSLATGTMWFPECSDDEDDWKSTENSDDEEVSSSPDAQNDSMLNIVDVVSLGTGVLRSKKVPQQTSDENSSNVVRSTTFLKGSARDELATPQISNTSATRSIQGTPPSLPIPVPPNGQ